MSDIKAALEYTSKHRTTSNLAYLRRFNSFWASVSHITIGDRVPDKTVAVIMAGVSDAQAPKLAY